MAENMMNSDHKATNPTFRKRYDNMTWGVKKKGDVINIEDVKNKKKQSPEKVDARILRKFIKHSEELDW